MPPAMSSGLGSRSLPHDDRDGDEQRDERPHDVHRHHDLAPVDPVRDDPGRQREHQPRQPLGDGDHGDQDGSRVTAEASHG